MNESRNDNEGARLRRQLGLTVNLALCAAELEVPSVPNPYLVTCLEGEENDNLLKLAKASFGKISRGANTSNWNPTSIQLQSWAILKSKKSKTKTKRENSLLNLIAIATTGSGKTLAYTVPMVDSCMLNKGKKSRRYVHGLVLVPTRELALQVSKVLKIVSKTANRLSGKTDKIVALAVYGGIDREEQVDSLSKNSQYILAATPLRLIDLLGIGCKDGSGNESVPNEKIQRLFETTQYLVIDEADQMALKSDMSQQVDLIIKFLKERSIHLEKQCLFSATLPRRAISKCNEWIDLPSVTVKVDTVSVGSKIIDGKVDTGKAVDRRGPLDYSTVPAHITQTLHVCSNHKKPKKLMTTINKIRKLEKEGGNRRRKGLLIIFFGRIKTLQYVHGLLQKDQITGVALHSQMNQQKRESQLNIFRSGKCPILLATDVAARGIHIKNVEYIINYDFCSSLEQYVHRCGRAGRNKVSGRSGDDKTESNAIVYSFFNREMAPMASDVVELLKNSNAWVDPNLIALIPGKIKHNCGESKRKKRKRDGNNSESPELSVDTKISDSKKENELKTIVDSEDDEFADQLNPNRIMFKRASHVTLDSDTEEDGS